MKNPIRTLITYLPALYILFYIILALIGLYFQYMRFKNPDMTSTRLFLCVVFDECK